MDQSGPTFEAWMLSKHLRAAPERIPWAQEGGSSDWRIDVCVECNGRAKLVSCVDSVEITGTVMLTAEVIWMG